MLTVVPGGGSGHDGGKDGAQSLIDEIVREGTRRMLTEALQAEVDAYIARFADERMRMAGVWWCAMVTIGRGRS